MSRLADTSFSLVTQIFIGCRVTNLFNTVILVMSPDMVEYDMIKKDITNE